MKRVEGGLVIALDGPDGVGKSTQIRLLAKELSDQGYSVHVTRSSGGTPIGEALREVSTADIPRPAETDLHISLAMNVALVDDLKEHRANGDIVLIDRSPLAIIAYNGFGSQLADQDMAFQAAGDIFKRWAMDMLIVFDAGSQILEQRLRLRTDKQADFYEKQDAAYYARVQAGYVAGYKFVRNNKAFHLELREIDASGSIEDIHQQVLEEVQSLLNKASTS